MSKKLIAVSLFTGAGGMDVGFERPGTKVANQRDGSFGLFSMR